VANTGTRRTVAVGGREGGGVQITIAVKKEIGMLKPVNLTIFMPGYMGRFCWKVISCQNRENMEISSEYKSLAIQ
jgi:hypothetical protein